MATATEAAATPVEAQPTAPDTEPPKDGDAPRATAGVGIIYPPPEVRGVVDKTAQYVARNGWDFVEKIRAREESKVKFKFLNPADPYHAYFVHKVTQFQDGTAAPSAEMNVDIGDMDTEEEAVEKLEPPPEPEFIVDPPTIQAQDLDIVKLTAQYVALNGRQFLTKISRREERNYQFDFLKPQHSMFHTFTTLVEQYSKVLRPKPETLERLKELSLDTRPLLATVRKAAAYQKQVDEDRERAAAAADAERDAMASINWHDFVLVGTLEFTTEDVNLPYPVPNPGALGARLIEAEKFEREQKLKAQSAPSGQDDLMDMEMDIDDEEEEKKKPAQQPPPPTAVPTQIKIRQYDPKAAKKTQAPAGDQYVTSPLTGERILASKVSEHLRIALLDPKWREQKERMEAEKQKTIEQWMQGASAVESNLKDIAARRTDIFGHGDVETEIGLKVGEKPKTLMEQAAEEAAKTAQAAAASSMLPPPPSGAPPVRQPPPQGFAAPPVQQPSGLPASTLLPKPGPPKQAPAQQTTQARVLLPTPTSAPVANSAPNLPPPKSSSIGGIGNMAPSGIGSLTPSIGHMAPSGGAPPPATAAGGIGGMAPRQSGFPSMAAPNSAPAAAAPPSQAEKPLIPASEYTPDGPPSKRPRNTGQMSEAEFLAAHKGTFKITIVVPEEDERFNITAGQTITCDVSYGDKISALKNKIQSKLGMPSNKQKLQLGDTVLANSSTLASYNLTEDSRLQLGVKERGGRKK